MSNELAPSATDDDPALDEPPRLIPPLRLVAADDVLLCVDDACLPPDVRPTSPDDVVDER